MDRWANWPGVGDMWCHVNLGWAADDWESKFLKGNERSGQNPDFRSGGFGGAISIVNMIER